MFGTASRGRNGLRGPTGICWVGGGGCELRVKPTEDRVKGESETGERPRPWKERTPPAQGTGKARPKRQGTTSSRRGFALVDPRRRRCTGRETNVACASRRRAASQSRRLPDPNVECVPRGKRWMPVSAPRGHGGRRCGWMPRLEETRGDKLTDNSLG